MDILPNELKKLKNELEKLPGVGPKSAIRMCIYFLGLEKIRIKYISEIFEDLTKNIKKCLVCGAYSNYDVCQICSDESRTRNLILIVEDFFDLISFESFNGFDGYYHILGGLISPVNGITPKDLNISGLKKRILKLESIQNLEVIFGISPSLEGEATARYIQDYLSDITQTKIQYSFLARGLPSSADIEYVDNKTLQNALENRTTL